MIRNSLSILLVEKRIKVTELAKMAGLSRNAVTATALNHAKMIQLATINQICEALNITPAELFEYVPFDFDYDCNVGKLDKQLNDKVDVVSYELTAHLNISKNHQQIESIEFIGHVENDGSFEHDSDLLNMPATLYVKNEKELDKLTPFLKQLSPSFITDVKIAFGKVLNQSLVDKKLADDIALLPDNSQGINFTVSTN